MDQQLTKPFFMEGSSDLALLLIHGFTASPTEMLPLGKYFQKKFSVSGIRLAGHGTDINDLLKVTRFDWIQSGLNGFDDLIAKGFRQIVVIGLSMGGLIACQVASQRPVFGICCLSTPLGLQSVNIHRSLLPIVNIFKKTYPKSEKTISELKKYNLQSYHSYPIYSIRQLLSLIIETKKILPKLTIPALIMTNTQDKTITLNSGEELYRRLGTSDSKKNLEIFSELVVNNHIITVGKDASEVFTKIEKFILEI